MSCCPQGYTIYTNIGCCPDSDPTCSSHAAVPTIPCTCCPPNYAFINAEGQFLNTYGILQLLGNPNRTSYAGLCVQIVNTNWAIVSTDPPINPVACLCCPPGYIYNSLIGACQNILNPKLTDARPIPCVVVCPEPPPFVCPGCQESGGLPINFTVPTCEDCYTDSLFPQPLPGFAAGFLPVQLADPITNFKRY